MASLAIRKLRTRVRLGCKPEERAYPRICELDILVHYDMRDAVRSDSLELGVDYNHVAVGVERMAREREWNLIEAFAADVARVALGLTDRIHEVEVTARREVMVSAAVIEVTLRMDRQGSVR